MFRSLPYISFPVTCILYRSGTLSHFTIDGERWRGERATPRSLSRTLLEPNHRTDTQSRQPLNPIKNNKAHLSRSRQTQHQDGASYAEPLTGTGWPTILQHRLRPQQDCPSLLILVILANRARSTSMSMPFAAGILLTWVSAFGNSLSYVSSNGGVVAPESMPFDGTLATSEREIAVFSDKACDQDCPYWRPNATSHFGWTGSSKAFFIEFQMDHYQNTGTDQGMISDAPAWWFLNAAIPRVLQYGSDRNNIPCSCWSTGCGEFDAFEVLGNGEERAKSTLHRQGNLEGGDSNYFKRPVGRMLKFAVIWTYPNITALVLDDDFDFSESLSDDQIQQLVSYDPDSWVHSLFAIGD